MHLLSEHFEIKTESQNIADHKYLYRCFGEKIKQYNYKNELVIPFSDNYDNIK